MLANQQLKAFIPTLSAEGAKNFYRDRLGLRLVSEDPYGLDFVISGSALRISIVNELNAQTFTVLGWNVANINSAIEWLNKKGIQCEKYPDLEQDNLGVWTSPSGAKVAWFKDPDGNILSVSE
jgi:catechol 2,3-dioxygenase-like lactoylglutathione lyase family enzyme